MEYTINITDYIYKIIDTDSDVRENRKEKREENKFSIGIPPSRNHILLENKRRRKKEKLRVQYENRRESFFNEFRAAHPNISMPWFHFNKMLSKHKIHLNKCMKTIFNPLTTHSQISVQKSTMKSFMPEQSRYILPEHYFTTNSYIGYMFLLQFHNETLESSIEMIKSQPHKPFGKKQKPSKKAVYEPLYKAYVMNQRLRLTFKAFLNRIRYSKLKIVNIDDPVTLEKPIKPIYIVDWAQRKKYQYEASSYLGDCRARLLQVKYGEATPHPLRNIISNVPLTLFQQISVHKQILKYGLTHWTIELLHDSAYDIQEFALVNSKKLSIECIRDDIYNYDSDKYTISRFIADTYAENEVRYDEDFYDWILSNKTAMESSIMKDWLSSCFLYFKIHILYRENVIETIRQQAKIKQTVKKYIEYEYKLKKLKRTIESK